MDNGELSGEAKHNDGSLHFLANPVTEVTGQRVPVGNAEASNTTLQASGMST